MRLSWLTLVGICFLALSVRAEDLGVDSDELDALIDDGDSAELGGGKLDELILSIENGRSHFRRSGIWAARKYPESKRLVEKLIEYVRRQEPEFASIAAVTLGEMKAKSAVPVLRAALAHGSEWVRESAAYALGLIGERSAAGDLRKRQPESPGLSRWIYQDAIARLEGRTGAPTPHQRSLKGASIYYLGAAGSTLRDSWRELIGRYDLEVAGVVPPPLNVVMGKMGGPPNTREFYHLLKDEGDRPQVDAVLVSGLLPYEFPAKLRWRLFQFVRRGGLLIVLGDAMFVSGEVRSVTRQVVHYFAMPPQPWQSCLPQTLDDEFRPFISGFRGEFRNMLRSGVRDFGHGRTLVLASDRAAKLPVLALDRRESHEDHRNKNWGRDIVKASHYENLLLYAFEGEQPFRALLDLRGGPDSIVAGNTAVFELNAFSSAGGAGKLEIKVALDGRVVTRQGLDVKLRSTEPLRLSPQVPLSWTLQDGNYEARLKLRVGDSESSSAWTFGVASPLRISWEMDDSYEEPGRALKGSARVENQRDEAVRDVQLVLEVSDWRHRVLQRASQAAELEPGRNGPFRLELLARDYRIDTYWLTLKLIQRGQTLQCSRRHLYRTGPYHFQQDLVYVPWNTGALPTEKRMRRLMIDSGFNGIWGLAAIPGWYNWGVDGPIARCKAMWPGDMILNTTGPKNMTMVEFGKFLRHRLPGYTIVDPWDETGIELVVNERGEDLGPIASACYRNWLKSRYLTLDALNEVWRTEYQIQTHQTGASSAQWSMPAKTRIPPPRPWRGDLTSWNQVWAWRGAPRDWLGYAQNLWGTIIFSECHSLFRKTDPNHWWHWADAYHTRLYTGLRPGNLNWANHRSHARWGNRPSTIMLHFCYVHAEKRPGPVRRFHWDGLAGGGRHFINWSPNLGPVVGMSQDTSIWNADYTLKPHGKAIADSIFRVRAKEQVLLDAWNALSKEVAFLYNDAKDSAHGGSTPRALFEALLFGGLHPDALDTGTLRSERTPLDPFRVILLSGARELPTAWRERVEEWVKNGGKLLYADDFGFEYHGDRIESPGFTAYQAKVFERLRELGVVPPVQVVDDNGLPEPAVEPVLLETKDRSQQYLLAAPDWALDHSQAFGDLGSHQFTEKVDIAGDLAAGAAFEVTGKAPLYQLWAEVRIEEPFKARVTVDGKPGEVLVDYREYPSVLWAERGVGQTRWVAGPAFRLEGGEHVLKIEPQEGRSKIRRVWLVDDQLLRPRLLCSLPGVKAIYDVLNDRLLDRSGKGWRMPLRASYGEIYGLITEDLGSVEIEPRLVSAELDRRLQLRISVRQADGSLSRCRHALNIRVRDGQGREIEGMFQKASVRGWKVVTLYPAHEDPPLPWTIEVKDLTSGRTGSAKVTTVARELFAEAGPQEPVVLRAEATPSLEGDIHLVPLCVTVENHQNEALKGRLKLEVSADLLIDAKPRLDIEVPPHTTRTFEWPLVLGRKQAIQLMDRPPRAWLTTEGGKIFETQFGDVWVLRWERQPPLVTNLSSGEIPVRIQNFLSRQVRGKLGVGLSSNWEMEEPVKGDLTMDGATSDSPVTHTVGLHARLKPFAEQRPEVFRMPLKLMIGPQAFEAGHRLVEVEKRRQWHTALPPPEIGAEFEPEMPAEPQDAKKVKLWNLDWQLHERDTLIDFQTSVGQRIFAVTNVCFVEDGEVSVRVRGDEKVDAWLAGDRLLTEKPKEGEPVEELEPIAHQSVPVRAGKWIPLVIRYRRMSAHPNTDFVFLGKQGEVIWTAEFRAVR